MRKVSMIGRGVLTLLTVLLLLPCLSVKADSKPSIPKKLTVNVGPVSLGSFQVRNKQKEAVYTFYSSDETIVKIGKTTAAIDGIRPGKAVITCKQTLDGNTITVGTCNVTVKQAYVYTSQESIVLAISAESDIYLEYGIPDAEYIYKSENERIATVSDIGAVTGHTAGKTVITCTEKYNGKSVLIDSIAVEVVESSLKINEYEISLNRSRDIKMDIYYLLKNGKPDADYQLISGNTELCRVEKTEGQTGQFDSFWFIPLEEGSTEVTVVENYNGVSKTLGQIKVKVTPVEPYLSKVHRYDEEIEKNPFLSVSKDVEGDLRPHINFAPANAELRFASNNTSVVKIDSATGKYTSHQAGDAWITIEMIGTDLKLMYNIRVLEEDILPQQQELSKIAYKRAEALNLDEITEDNLVECRKKLAEIYNLLVDDYSMTLSDYLYYGRERFQMLPNSAKFYEYDRKWNEVFDLYYSKIEKERKIERVTVVDSNTLKVEFNIPFTAAEYAYCTIMDESEGLNYESWNYFSINTKNGNYGNGICSLKPGVKSFEVRLQGKLRKGNYILVHNMIPDQGFSFTY